MKTAFFIIFSSLRKPSFISNNGKGRDNNQIHTMNVIVSLFLN